MSKGRILIVDDEEVIRKSVRLILTKAGYDVLEAEDGEKAISRLLINDNPFKVGLIICDIEMPKLNGMEAIAYFRQEFPSVPVIVLTGHPALSGAIHLFKQGIVDVVAHRQLNHAPVLQVVGIVREVPVERDSIPSVVGAAAF